MRKSYSLYLSCIFLLFFSLLSNTTFADDKSALTITDLAGRTLNFSDTPKKVILGDSRHLSAFAILYRENPIAPIAATLSDLRYMDYGSYKLYQKKFPKIENIPVVGHHSADSFSVESAINIGADLAVFGIEGHGPTAHHSQLITQLQRAGIQVVFIDFRQNPIKNTTKSIRLLGQILKREKQAKEFIDFYKNQLAIVESRLKTIKKSPKVFIHSRAGLQDHCCETMVKGMIAGLLTHVKGENIAEDIVPGYAGTFNLEYLLNNQPDIYIATAVGGAEEKDLENNESLPYIHLGAGVSEERAQASFRYMLAENNLTGLKPVQNGKAYSIWHHFYNSPLNIVAVQVFSKWLYPEAFIDLDPQKTMQTLYQRFQSIPLEGIYWLTLKKNSINHEQ